MTPDEIRTYKREWMRRKRGSPLAYAENLPGRRQAGKPRSECRHTRCGCRAAKCCLDCPLPACVYDDPSQRHQSQRIAGVRELVVFMRDSGASAAKTADTLEISRRTVLRHLQHERAS